MATAYQITCINKTDRYSAHDRISHVGGSGWKVTVATAIAGIQNGTHSFYVYVNGSRADVIIARSAAGNLYLKTTADGEQPNNLLSLPECP